MLLSKPWAGQKDFVVSVFFFQKNLKFVWPQNWEILGFSFQVTSISNFGIFSPNLQYHRSEKENPNWDMHNLGSIAIVCPPQYSGYYEKKPSWVGWTWLDSEAACTAAVKSSIDTNQVDWTFRGAKITIH